MLHKDEDEDAETLFRASAAFAEHIGEIGADDTMTDVYTQVQPQLVPV
jgi:hypothetical protein